MEDKVNDIIIEFIEVNIQPKFIIPKKIYRWLTETFGVKVIYIIFSIILLVISYCGIVSLLKRKYDVFLMIIIAFFIVLGFMLTLLGW
ncbi:hypothetical protein Toce_0159 [Thermosediminibacter oceani DSM 16646]|uniref:Uncharacterized protein n=1 Tax=Thermosediminibacter oceani (strain ATCC BAA-1034 / DSM 16646 / JW/IW-1228P) TaxID=555079 RepID=D9S022_THEOJ|nr:hypothetical protein Toce_0159 [Thermosediminibacter oceani DSM 16646]